MEVEEQNRRYGTNTGFLGDEQMQAMEYTCLNAITPGVEGISLEDNHKSLDYFLYVMGHLKKLPIKVSQE